MRVSRAVPVSALAGLLFLSAWALHSPFFEGTDCAPFVVPAGVATETAIPTTAITTAVDSASSGICRGKRLPPAPTSADPDRAASRVALGDVHHLPELRDEILLRLSGSLLRACAGNPEALTAARARLAALRSTSPRITNQFLALLGDPDAIFACVEAKDADTIAVVLGLEGPDALDRARVGARDPSATIRDELQRRLSVRPPEGSELILAARLAAIAPPSEARTVLEAVVQAAWDEDRYTSQHTTAWLAIGRSLLAARSPVGVSLLLEALARAPVIILRLQPEGSKRTALSRPEVAAETAVRVGTVVEAFRGAGLPTFGITVAGDDRGLPTVAGFDAATRAAVRSWSTSHEILGSEAGYEVADGGGRFLAAAASRSMERWTVREAAPSMERWMAREAAPK